MNHHPPLASCRAMKVSAEFKERQDPKASVEIPDSLELRVQRVSKDPRDPRDPLEEPLR